MSSRSLTSIITLRVCNVKQIIYNLQFVCRDNRLGSSGQYIDIAIDIIIIIIIIIIINIIIIIYLFFYKNRTNVGNN